MIVSQRIMEVMGHDGDHLVAGANGGPGLQSRALSTRSAGAVGELYRHLQILGLNQGKLTPVAANDRAERATTRIERKTIMIERGLSAWNAS